jgi:hypothetical protein
MAKKNSTKKRQSRIADALVRERKQLEKQRERELKMKEEEEKTSVGRQMREKRSKKHPENTTKGGVRVLTGGIQKQKKSSKREGKNRHKIVRGVRVGNATKIRKNVTYGGITIKESESKKAVLEMLKAEDRMMV